VEDPWKELLHAPTFPGDLPTDLFAPLNVPPGVR
jgi:hypothetical protein